MRLNISSLVRFILAFQTICHQPHVVMTTQKKFRTRQQRRSQCWRQWRMFFCFCSFQDFDLQGSHRCSSDWMSISSYRSLDGLRVCGSSLPPPYISSQDHVWIHFHSDDSLTGKGFRLSYITGEAVLCVLMFSAWGFEPTTSVSSCLWSAAPPLAVT